MNPGVDFYRHLLDDMFDGVYFVDLDRRITYWNRGAERITGYTAEEVVGRKCANNVLMHVDDCGTRLCKTGCPLKATIVDRQARAAEVFLHHKQGHRVSVAVRATPMLDDDGNVVGAVEIFSENGEKMAAIRQVKDLERTAYLDDLTGLANRRFARNFLSARQQEARDFGWHYGVVMCDIDDFKRVNDALGHDAGDDVLRMVGTTLGSAVRASDLVARWGGEEFLVVLANVSLADLARTAERMRVLVGESVCRAMGQAVAVTISAGAVLAGAGERPEDAVKRADAWLYEGKHAGRNRVMGEWLRLAA
ncbi:MAG: diguanylate cyclase [Chloroflexi bacterium]|nr:diguanylate cyclase [Chloroflexota bacterium]